MKGRCGRMGRYKVNAVRVKKAKQTYCVVRPHGYEMNNPRRNEMTPRNRVEVKWLSEILNLKVGLTLLFALFVYVCLLYKLFKIF